MNSIKESLDEVSKLLPEDALEVEVYRYLLHRFKTLGRQFERLTLGGVAADLGWTEDRARSTALTNALELLASASPPLLERRFELWSDMPSHETLEEPINELSEEQVRTAIEIGELIDPDTGETFKDFRNRITVVYLVTEEARETAQNEALR